MTHPLWIIVMLTALPLPALMLPPRCQYKGVAYVEGDLILISEPCLACWCKQGALDCLLRDCSMPSSLPSPGDTNYRQTVSSPRTLKPELDVTTKESYIEQPTESNPKQSSVDKATESSTKQSDEEFTFESITEQSTDTSSILEEHDEKTETQQTTTDQIVTEVTPPDVTFRNSDETTTLEVDYTNTVSTDMVTAAPKKEVFNLRMDNPTTQPSLDIPLNTTEAANDDYDAYDYSEPRLPPSLPNLVIFPFVAADAVTKENKGGIEERIDETSSPNYLNNFSPPSETQGGFVPKDDKRFSDGTPSITNSPQAEENVELLAPENNILHLEPIVSKEAFPDVIKAEAAPDLPSLMGEILPFLREQQTNKPVSVNYKHGVVQYYPQHHITTTKTQHKTTHTIHQTILAASSTEALREEHWSSETPVYYSPITETPKSHQWTSKSPVLFTTMSGDDSYNDTQQQKSENEVDNPTTSFPISLNNTQQTIFESISNETFAEPVNATQLWATVAPVNTSTAQSLKKTSVDNKLLATTERIRKKSTTNKITAQPSATESDSFLEQFLKDFFESNEENSTTTLPSMPKFNHKYSSQLLATTILPPTTMPSVQIIENREGQETANSLSLDTVLHALFDAEATTKSLKKSHRPHTKKTKRPSTTIPTVSPSAVNTEQPLSPETPQAANHLNENKITNIKREQSLIGKEPQLNVKKEDSGGEMIAILKLAGCNIYGRMYRVGKIIVELTSPCLECMCTETGVQCSRIVC